MTNCIIKMQTKKVKDLVFYCSMLALPMLQLFIFYFYVNFNSIILAFRSYQNGAYVNVGFTNFTNLFKQLSTDVFLKVAFKNSFIAYSSGLLISLPTSLFMSFYIYKKKAYGFKTLVFLPAIIPVVVLTRIFWQVSDSILPTIVQKFSKTSEFRGLLNDTNTAFMTVTLYSIFTGFGPSVLIYSGSMSNISESVVESAQLDGVTPIKEFWYITIPYIAPVIITVVVVGVANIFNNQVNLYSFYTSEADSRLYTLGYYVFVKSTGARKVNFPPLATLGLFLTAIIAPVTYLVKWLLSKLDPTAESR